MPLLLSVPDFISQQTDTSLLKALRQPWTIPLKDRTGSSHGYRQGVNLRSGLDFLIDDYTLQEDLIVELGNSSPCEPNVNIEMSFMLAGHNRNEGVQTQHSFFDASWDDGTKDRQAYWQAGERVLKFDIHIKPALFETLVGEQIQVLPASLRQVIQGSRPFEEHFLQVGATTAPMRSAIHQILHCPYQGLTRWLYWESKVIELIALRLEQVSKPQPLWVVGLPAEDVDRIYYARDILCQRFVDPPSLLELARLIGLNDRKLKEGFRQVFGTTVFGYLSQQRMEKACQLLKEQQPVAAVAAAVGYASPTSFSGTFRRQFGVSPKGYQLAKRR